MRIGIIGTGAYALALATVLNENKNEITMWTKFESEKEELETKHQNEKVLKDITFPDSWHFTTNLKECIQAKEMVFWAIPAEFLTTTLKECAPLFTKDQIICLATKGIEQKSGRFLHEIILEQATTKHLAIISGPSFAIDIIKKLPIGLTLASSEPSVATKIQAVLTTSYLKVRTTDDMIGTAICGAIKNVIAIAAGILDGLEATESTKAMFITESLHDVKEFIQNYQGNGKTILSFAGFGDILLTCTSPKSRNYRFGQILSTKQQETIKNYQQSHTVEGIYTLEAIYKQIKKKKMNMPIIELIYDIVYHQKDPKALFTFLIEKK